MIRKALWVWSCAAILSAGCVVVTEERPRGGGGSSGASSKPASQASGDPGASAVEATAETTTLKVVNKSSQSITHIYLSPANETSWGPDILDVDILVPGQTCDITGVDEGVWDIRCLAEEGDELVFYDQSIDGAGAILTIVDQ